MRYRILIFVSLFSNKEKTKNEKQSKIKRNKSKRGNNSRRYLIIIMLLAAVRRLQCVVYFRLWNSEFIAKPISFSWLSSAGISIRNDKNLCSYDFYVHKNHSFVPRILVFASASSSRLTAFFFFSFSIFPIARFKLCVWNFIRILNDTFAQCFHRIATNEGK